MAKKLTAKQQRFVEEYLIDLNATQAAIRAGYSPKTAHEQGAQLLAKLSIKEEVDKVLAERSRRTGITQDRVLRELAKIAFVNTLQVVDTDDAKVRHDIDEDDAAAIASVKVKTIPTEDGDIVEREVKLHDKLKALELLGRHLGMFDKADAMDATVNLVINTIYGPPGTGGEKNE